MVKNAPRISVFLRLIFLLPSLLVNHDQSAFHHQQGEYFSKLITIECELEKKRQHGKQETGLMKILLENGQSNHQPFR